MKSEIKINITSENFNFSFNLTGVLTFTCTSGGVSHQTFPLTIIYTKYINPTSTITTIKNINYYLNYTTTKITLFITIKILNKKHKTTPLNLHYKPQH